MGTAGERTNGQGLLHKHARNSVFRPSREKHGKREKEKTAKLLIFNNLAILFVGVPGLEPGKAGPESAVLPLHHTPIPLQ